MGDSAGPANPTKPAVLIIGGLGMSFAVLGPVVNVAAHSMLAITPKSAIAMVKLETDLDSNA